MNNIKTTCFNNDDYPRFSIRRSLPIIVLSVGVMALCMYYLVQAIPA